MGEEMGVAELDILERLDEKDQEMVKYFLRLLLSKTKYRKLREEIAARRKEVERGDALTHTEIWDQLDV
jgi:hypothetical protein